ncbi:hypothetical protein RIF29_26168 [Crotalaria pallida]|uniref:EF-hand domain-containing protein n=1 Tax=Crotalaria pallida TaxID=3830 RepID=A0AAN9ENC0_CROPI
MFHSFITCFIFLHRKAKFLFYKPRSRPNKRFSSTLDLSSTTSFLHMKVSGQFQHVFKLIDTNGDGKISTTELSEMLSCLGHNKCMAAKEAEGMVRVLDINGDGFVDMDEFMVVMNDDREGRGKVVFNDDYLKDAFLVYDTDNNGLISPQELQTVLLNLGCDNCSLRECKRMIKGVDKNGDGFVDFQEFRSMMKTGLAN